MWSIPVFRLWLLAIGCDNMVVSVPRSITVNDGDVTANSVHSTLQSSSLCGSSYLSKQETKICRSV